MARVKIRLKQVESLLKEAERTINQKAAKEIAKTIIVEMKELIEDGKSPIAGRGRFPAYKDTKKYPGRVKKKFPDKKNRPVNLRLSGKFLSQLKETISPVQKRITIGFSSGYGRKLESGHRDGVKGQPKRPIIPGEGEQLAKSIQAVILKLYEQAVRKYLRSR